MILCIEYGAAEYYIIWILAENIKYQLRSV